MSTTLEIDEPRLNAAASSALTMAARLWFAVAVIGQWAFLYYIVAFYGPSTMRGNFKAWTKNADLTMSYVPGDIAGNLFFGAHVLLAAIIAFGGALQLVPQIRRRAPAFHRWNGRVFSLVALSLSVDGLYLVWVRGDRSGLVGGLALTLNAALIIACVLLAWRHAVGRRIADHRRWAMRAYLVSNAQWFTRIGVFAWIVIGHGAGLTDNFDGWFNYFIVFGCYGVPLAMLELFLRTRDGAGTARQFAMAGGLVAATIVMAVGIVALYTLSEAPFLSKL